MKIDMDKSYETTNGRPVRILTLDRANSTYKVVGLVMQTDGTELVECWTVEGKWGVGVHDKYSMDLQLADPLKPFRRLAVDTPVWVSDCRNSGWQPAHWSGLNTGTAITRNFRTFSDGKTSHSSGGDHDHWIYCSLTDPT